MSATHRTVQSPQPDLRSLVVIIDETTIVNHGGILPKEGTMYNDPQWVSLMGYDYNLKFSKFRYVTQIGDVKEGAQCLFVYSKTDTEKNTPYRTIWRTGNHYWPPILEWIDVYEAIQPNLPPAYYSKRGYRSSVNEGSRFRDEYFFSDTPYDLSNSFSGAPQPTEVSMSGLALEFPKCLHPEIETPTDIALLTSAAITLIATFGSNPERKTDDNPKDQLYPATNVQFWEPYILDRTPTFENGYAMKRTTVFPPIPTPITEG